MEMNKCCRKVKCDFYGCNNLAQYCFSVKGVIKKDLCFCEECMKGVFECISKLQIPKAVESPFNLKKRLKNEKK